MKSTLSFGAQCFFLVSGGTAGLTEEGGDSGRQPQTDTEEKTRIRM